MTKQTNRIITPGSNPLQMKLISPPQTKKKEKIKSHIQGQILDLLR